MLHDLLGVAFIGMGALTMVARVMARAADLQRRTVRGSLRLTADGALVDPARPRLNP